MTHDADDPDQFVAHEVMLLTSWYKLKKSGIDPVPPLNADHTISRREMGDLMTELVEWSRAVPEYADQLRQEFAPWREDALRRALKGNEK